MTDEKNASKGNDVMKENFINIFELEKVQVNPLEQFKIPIDLVTRTAMNINLDAGKEQMGRKRVPIIPDGITTDQIIKTAIKAQNYEFKGLKLGPANTDITADDIVEMGEKANLFRKGFETVYKSPIDNHILTPAELSKIIWREYEYYFPDDNGGIVKAVITEHLPFSVIPKDSDGAVDISEIIKCGIEKGVPAFLDLPIVAVGKTDAEILEKAKSVGLFGYETVTEGTGVFADSEKKVALRESRKGNLSSEVKILVKNADTAIISKEFDYGVLSACISEKLNGNEYTTVSRIYHLLGGGKVLHPQMRQKILDSLEKLDKIQVTIDYDGETIKRGIVGFKATKNERKNGAFYRGRILPNETLSISYNGQVVDAIHLLKGGAIFNNANWRNQFATCAPDLLHLPVQATVNNIATNHYLLRRSLEIIGSNDPDRKHVTRLRNIITFEDLYKRVGVDTKLEKQRTRKIAIKILDFFVEKGLLKGYTLDKKDSGKVYSIHIQF